MNRRNFLTSLVAIPIIGLAITSPEIIPKQPIRKKTDGEFYSILEPHEMEDYGFVSIPLSQVIINGKGYCVKTWRLRNYTEILPDLPDPEWLRQVQTEASINVHKLGITHVYCLGFLKYPVIMHDESKRYAAFVRGFSV